MSHWLSRGRFLLIIRLGQTNDERGSSANCTLDTDPALVGIDDFLAGGQSQTRSSLTRIIGAGFGGVERIEDLGQRLAGNSAALLRTTNSTKPRSFPGPKRIMIVPPPSIDWRALISRFRSTR